MPSLSQVHCERWQADAGGRSCGWSLLHIECSRAAAEVVDSLPRGVAVLRLASVKLDTAATLAASSELLQGLARASGPARAISEAIFLVSWQATLYDFYPEMTVKTDSTPPGLVAPCIAASQPGLQASSSILPDSDSTLDDCQCVCRTRAC